MLVFDLGGHRGLDKSSDLVISRVLLCQDIHSGLPGSSTRPLLSAAHGSPGYHWASPQREGLWGFLGTGSVSSGSSSMGRLYHGLALPVAATPGPGHESA